MPRPIGDYLRGSLAFVSDVDADRILIQDNRQGTYQLYESDGAGSVRPLTGFDESVSGVYIPGSRDLLIGMASGGNERTQLYRLDPTTGARTDIAVDPRHIHARGGISRDGRLLAYATNRRNGVDFDVIVRDLHDGTEHVVYDGGGETEVGGFSPDGRYLAYRRPGDRPLDEILTVADLRAGRSVVIAPDRDAALRGFPRWLPDSSAFYMATNVGRDMAGVAKVDVRTGGWRYVLTPRWDARVVMSDDNSTLFVITNEDGADRVEVRDSRTLQPRGELALPGEGTVPRLLSPDGDRVIYSFDSPTYPPDVRMLTRSTGAERTIVPSGLTVPRRDLVAPTHHTITSFDGEQISALLFRPRHTPGRRPPVVVKIHGGPEGQSDVSFDPMVQYLVGHGYAVVVPNVRGSTGYGKRFYGLDDRQKRLDSVRDLAAVHGWLGSAGLDPGRAALYGGSYGGYMVLAGLSMQPDLWAAGIDVVGISNLETFLENTSAYRRRRREHEYGYLASDRPFLAAASPITHVNRIRAPLMIFHGRNDPRVPVSEAEQLDAALRGRGVPSELVIYENEGHGIAKLANRLDAYPRMVDFLDRTIGPRSIAQMGVA